MIALQASRHGIGCSHLVANLAVILMHHGYRVGLLDTDAQVGGIRTLFGLDETSEKDLNAYWWLSPDTQSIFGLMMCRQSKRRRAFILRRWAVTLPSTATIS